MSPNTPRVQRHDLAVCETYLTPMRPEIDKASGAVRLLKDHSSGVAYTLDGRAYLMTAAGSLVRERGVR